MSSSFFIFGCLLIRMAPLPWSFSSRNRMRLPHPHSSTATARYRTPTLDPYRCSLGERAAPEGRACDRDERDLGSPFYRGELRSNHDPSRARTPSCCTVELGRCTSVFLPLQDSRLEDPRRSRSPAFPRSANERSRLSSGGVREAPWLHHGAGGRLERPAS